MAELIFERDIAIPLRDGAVVHANLYRPADGGRAPVIMTMGPYGKDLHFGAFSSKAYECIDEHGPYLNWETPNPEWWVQQGFTVLRIDQRGSGASPGQLAVLSHTQALDFYDAIEWAAVQPWSTGKIGLLGVSYSVQDLDLFVTIRNLDPDGNDVHTIGTTGDPAPVAKGWLRASQRQLDPVRSLPYRPYHSHQVIRPMLPGEIVPLDVEIWPTSMIFEKGHRLALDLEAHDSTGAFPFVHTDPVDRNPAIFSGTNTIYSSRHFTSFLLLPLIPSQS